MLNPPGNPYEAELQEEGIRIEIASYVTDQQRLLQELRLGHKWSFFLSATLCSHCYWVANFVPYTWNTLRVDANFPAI